MPMTKTFTEDDLVRFLYDEVNEDERVDIKASICADFKLQEKANELKRVMRLLDDFQMKAPQDVISRILYASKNLSVSS